jgi:DNA-binding MarR family transcriptional regulator
MSALPPDLWESRALPILKYIAAHETDMGFITVGELSSALTIDGHAVTVELERLIDAGYIPGTLQKMMTGGDPASWFLTKSRLTERGARAISLWPSAEQLVETLEARAQAEADPARKKALIELLETARQVGVPVLAEILAAAAKRTMGLP